MTLSAPPLSSSPSGSSLAGTPFLDGRVVLHAGDCTDILDRLDAGSVDAVITDPPYHYNTIVKRFGGEGSAPAQFGADGAFARASAGFMGKQWDGGDVAFREETWRKVLRVLKPGGHLAAFSAPKCVHKMAIAIELAGFEVRDRIVHLHDPDPALIAFLESLTPAQADALFRLSDQFGALGEAFWCFGSGFPKSHNISKAIDRLRGTPGETVPAGAPVKRMIPGTDQHKGGWEKTDGREYQPGDYAPGSPEAEAWSGWGTALKPAYEPIVIARKPVAEASVAAQVLAIGTGGMNIDAARIEAEKPTSWGGKAGGGDTWNEANSGLSKDGEARPTDGRFPANLTHDGSAAAVDGFPGEAGAFAPVRGTEPSAPHGEVYGQRTRIGTVHHGDSGSAARFFYTAKADANDRLGSGHPTVKPVDLMRWLVRMLTPPGGTVLDPFSGTGTTGEAAWREGFSAVLIEREEEYRADIARRMELCIAGPRERRTRAQEAKAARRADAGEGGGQDLLTDLLGAPADTPPVARDGKSTGASPTKAEDRASREARDGAP